MEHEMLGTCREKFEKIERWIKEGDDEFAEIGKDIVKLDERQKSTQRSLDLVNKALWAIVAFSVTTLAAFFIWYVQTK